LERQSSTSLYTSEFRHEFEADTETLLRRRLQRFALAWGMAGVVIFIIRWGGSLLVQQGITFPLAAGKADWTQSQWVLAVLADALVLTMYLVTGMTVRNWKLSRRHLAEAPAVLIIAEIIIRLLAWSEVSDTTPLVMTTLSHLVACLYLPWNLWRALRPMIVVVILNIVFKLMRMNRIEAADWLALGLSPLALFPGAIVSWLKHSRRIEQFKMSALSRRYGEFKRELLDARKIHESMFPKAITNGSVTFWYEYEPMRGIGGDFVFSSQSDPAGPLSVVLVDVTGHGIAAALTVNRLYGELERVYAEDHTICPREVLRLLNRYIHLTMAKHSVYATAIVMTIHPKGDSIAYASAGHPPAFLRGVDGTIQELESTAFVLGVCAHEDFDAELRSLRFGPGDAIIAYTDGASEARDERGRMLGTAGMRSILAGTPVHLSQLAGRSLGSRPLDNLCGSWCRTVLSSVESYRHGPPDDDTLVVEITRPLARTGPRHV
jgi:hypothetical protein